MPSIPLFWWSIAIGLAAVSLMGLKLLLRER